MISLVCARILPLTLLVAAALVFVRRSNPAAFAARLLVLRRWWPALGSALLLLYVAGLGCALALPVAMDMVEVTVAELAALLVRGAPLYTAVDAAHRYSVLYGPLCALPFAAVLRLGGGMTALKLLVAAVDVVALLLLYAAFRRSLSRAGAVAAVGGVAAALMTRNLSTFQVRGDALLVLAVALALLAAGARRAWWAAAGFALAGALAVDVKFTAAFYLLLPLWLLWRRQRAAVAAAAVAGGAVLAALPFLLPAVSFRAYLVWLAEASHHPLSARLLLSNVLAAVLFALPAAVVFAVLVRGSVQEAVAVLRRHWLLVVLLAVSVLGSVVTGSKVGAGRSHLNGTAVVLAQLAVLLWARVPADRRTLPSLQVAALLYAPCLLVPALLQCVDLLHIGPQRRADALATLRELDGIAAAHPGERLEEGYDAYSSGGEPLDPLTLFRTRYVLAGGPVTVDAAALFDMQLSGLAIPASTVDLIRRCDVAVWVLPRSNEPPFNTRNGYVEDAPGRLPDPMLFSAAFRTAFTDSYRRMGGSTHFDIWECRRRQ